VAPNVLFIVADDLNSWIGALGRHPDVQTPHIDALADRGTLFTHAYCGSPYCNSSRMSVFTGCLPSTTGVYGNEPLWDTPDRPITFIELLREHGYYTFGAGKVFHGVFDYATAGRERRPEAPWREIENRPGLWDEFRTNEVDPLPDDRPLNRMFDFERFDEVPPPYHLFDWGPLPDDRIDSMPDAAVAGAVADFLRDPSREPFFCAAGIYKPHLPWHVPRAFFDLYDPDEIALPLVKRDDLDDVPEIGRRWALNPPDHELVTAHDQWRPAVHAYLASISYCDHVVGEIVRALDESGAGERTTVVLWGDNGFHLGEKLHWRKFVLWEEATRVPLIVAHPDRQAGRRLVHRPVGLIDLFPTLLDLCEVEAPAAVDGESLLPLVVGSDGPQPRKPVVSTWEQGNHSVRTPEWRFTRYEDGSEELYDHRADPYEWTNLAAGGGYEAVRRSLRRWVPHDQPGAKRVEAEPPARAQARSTRQSRPPADGAGPHAGPGGPAWLGIGAQRSGTTWFTELLLQHPEVCLSREGGKELHLLYGTLERPVDPDGYRRLFDRDGFPGEWTPYYLRAAGVAQIAAAVCRPKAPILVLLRDPVERFASAVRLYRGRQRAELEGLDAAARTRFLTADATWAGMYATQLAEWERHFPREQLVVMQYEAVRTDPEAAVTGIWTMLGLDPVPLRPLEEPSRTSSEDGWSLPDDTRGALRGMYADEAERMRSHWGFDLALWPNFAP
jgi:arylsulfatase A-like enzyme